MERDNIIPVLGTIIVALCMISMLCNSWVNPFYQRDAQTSSVETSQEYNEQTSSAETTQDHNEQDTSGDHFPYYHYMILFHHK